jgi:hypothetical protein
MDYDLGFFDKGKGQVEPAPNPFAGDNSVNYVSGIKCKPCIRYTPPRLYGGGYSLLRTRLCQISLLTWENIGNIFDFPTHNERSQS